jgi:hypothetical protein
MLCPSRNFGRWRRKGFPSMLRVCCFLTLEHLQTHPIQTMPLPCSPPCPCKRSFLSSLPPANALGPDGEQALKARLEQRSNGIPVLLTGAAAVAAFRALGVRHSRSCFLWREWLSCNWDDCGARTRARSPSAHRQPSGFLVCAAPSRCAGACERIRPSVHETEFRRYRKAVARQEIRRETECRLCMRTITFLRGEEELPNPQGEAR